MENDPDTLQMLDELDVDWGNAWKRLARKISGKKLTVNKVCPNCGFHPMTIDRSRHIQTITCPKCGCKIMQHYN